MWRASKLPRERKARRGEEINEMFHNGREGRIRHVRGGASSAVRTPIGEKSGVRFVHALANARDACATESRHGRNRYEAVPKIVQTIWPERQA